MPSMALTKKSGGHAVAVYDTRKNGGQSSCAELLRAGRVDFIAEADYRKGSKLSKRWPKRRAVTGSGRMAPYRPPRRPRPRWVWCRFLDTAGE